MDVLESNLLLCRITFESNTKDKFFCRLKPVTYSRFIQKDKNEMGNAFFCKFVKNDEEFMDVKTDYELLEKKSNILSSGIDRYPSLLEYLRLFFYHYCRKSFYDPKKEIEHLYYYLFYARLYSLFVELPYFYQHANRIDFEEFFNKTMICRIGRVNPNLFFDALYDKRAIYLVKFLVENDCSEFDVCLEFVQNFVRSKKKKEEEKNPYVIIPNL